MSRAIASLLFAVALVAQTSTVAARGNLEQHPADALVMVSGSVTSLNAVVSEFAALSVSNRLTAALARSVLKGALNFDSTDSATWNAHGISPMSVITASLALRANDLEARYRELIADRDWSRSFKTPLPLWRLRVVFPVVDSAKAIKLIRSLPLGVAWSPTSHRGERVADGIVVSVHRTRRAIVIDAVRPAFGVVSIPSSDALRAAFARPPRASSFERRSNVGAAKRLALNGVTVWLSSGSIATIGRSMTRETHIAEISNGAAGTAVVVAAKECRELSAAAGTLFADVSLRLSASERRLNAELSFGGDAALLKRAFPRKTHRLDLHRSKNASAGLVLWLANTAGLRGLARPRVLSAWPLALSYVRQCASYHSAEMQLFGWPLLAGLFVDELIDLGPRGRKVASGLGAVSLAVAKWDVDPLKTTGAIESTIAPDLEPIASELLGRVFGSARRSAGETQWGRGRIRPYLVNGRVGASFGGEPGFVWRTKRRGAVVPVVARKELLAAHLGSSSAVTGLARWFPKLTFLSGASSVRMRAFLRADQLVLDSVIARK